MKPPLVTAAIVATAVAVTWWLDRPGAPGTTPLESEAVPRSVFVAPPAGTSYLERARELVELPPPVVERWERERRPFEVATEQGGYGWTAEDGMRPEVMRVLANNSLMLGALGDENAGITRRQLVYAPSDFGERAQSLFRGDTTRLALPGFDGELFDVEVTHRFPKDVEAVSGGFAGRVAGGGEVTAASERDHWSIGIVSAGRSLQITTREQGEWIVVEADPDAVVQAGDCLCCALGQHVGADPPVSAAGRSLSPFSVDEVGRPGAP